MAGGMGSRYGGLKQVDSFGPNNEAILDYSIYDAISAGFNKIIILSSPKLQDYFKKKYKKIFSKVSSVSLEIVIQDRWETEAIPEIVGKSAKKISFLTKIFRTY